MPKTRDDKKAKTGAKKAAAKGSAKKTAKEGPKIPPQHQARQPGIEAEMTPRPRSEDKSQEGCGRLEGKVAIITGGDSGIGRAVAIAFAKEGADVAVVYLDEHQDAEETRRIVEEKGRQCLLIPGDVGDESFCRKAVERAVRKLGRLDVLVNNAAEQHEDLQSGRDRPGAARTDVPHQHLRLFLRHQGRPAAPGRGERRHQHHLGHRLPRQRASHRLRLDQGRDRGLHPLARAEPGRAKDPGQRAWRRVRSGRR